MASVEAASASSASFGTGCGEENSAVKRLSREDSSSALENISGGRDGDRRLSRFRGADDLVPFSQRSAAPRASLSPTSISPNAGASYVHSSSSIPLDRIAGFGNTLCFPGTGEICLRVGLPVCIHELRLLPQYLLSPISLWGGRPNWRVAVNSEQAICNPVSPRSVRLTGTLDYKLVVTSTGGKGLLNSLLM